MSDPNETPRPLTTSQRRALFLELARTEGGTSTSDVYKRALHLGDNVTEEAYHNLARRLVHRGLLERSHTPQGTRFTASSHAEERWLEEDDLTSLVDPDYPLLALTIWKETARQANDVPEEVWVELRERLRAQPARELFFHAIVSYCDELHAQLGYLIEVEKNPTTELPRLRKEAENTRRLLVQMVKYGLGISDEAVAVPTSLDGAVDAFRRASAAGPVAAYVRDEAQLRQELSWRVEDGPFVVDAEVGDLKRPLIIAGVDGSTRGGVLSFLGDSGDLQVGYAPMVAINTAIGQLNQSVRQGSRNVPVFFRLPEKPEDMQRQDNRYTVMAKLLHPDLSDAEYMHSVWNAMDLIECRTTLRVLGRWYGPQGLEIPPADVVLRDGPVSPQDRDFNHYKLLTSYGQIVRDMIQTSWDIARKSRDDAQTVGGVVKTAQLSVYAPVVNWYAAQTARSSNGQILTWPLQSMNVVADQVIMTRLLTAKRGKSDPWIRSCIVLRPFHAVTNYAQRYCRAKPPVDIILGRYNKAMTDGPDGDEDIGFWNMFRPDGDPYLAMLRNVSYGSLFLGAVPHLDVGKNLPRLEFLLVAPAADDSVPEPWVAAREHGSRLLRALRLEGFDVSSETDALQNESQIDVLPKLIVRAHETVKLWASELLSRVQEYIGYYLSRHVQQKRIRGVKVRPFTRTELEIFYDQLRREREMKAGASNPQQKLLKK